MISVYNNLTELNVNSRRLETMEKYNKIIAWGRKHPLKFIETILGVDLLDFQKYIIGNTWTAEKAVWLCSRNAGKSFLIAVYSAARCMLFPNVATYIMSNSARQSGDTHRKIEALAKKNIPSAKRITGVFYNEIVKNNSNTDGFVHSAQGNRCELYNGSFVESLVSDPNTVRGKRGVLNIYDEAGYIPNDFFVATRAFTAQNLDFATGIDQKIYPPNISTQMIYASSASGVDSELYTVYKDCAINMLMGVPGYFVADIGCEIPLHPKLNGVDSTPLLKQSEIDAEMRNNEQGALREYYNLFDDSGGANAAVSRSAINRNTIPYLPVFSSEGELKKYVICWDPAAQADNSTVLICEEYRDKEKGLKLKIVNSINLIEIISETQKRPLRTPEQVEWIRKIMLAYNGNAPEYQNIEVYLDGGAGGGGRQYADLLMGDWTDAEGMLHRGITDKDDEVSQEQRNKFPHAVECLHILNPTKFKTLIYTALGEMTSQDLIDFPDTDLRGDTKEIADGKEVSLTAEEIRALVEISIMKEEAMAMEKRKNKLGTISFDLPPNKAKKLHKQYCGFAA